MEVISSIYNSGYNIKKFYLGSRELNLAYLGNQVIYDEVIGDNDLNYILYEFYVSDTLPNTVEAPVKSAILSGKTGYRDIDTGEFLETFEEGRNLELVSVKLPVLKTVGKNLFNYSDLVAGEVIWDNSNNVNIFEDGWYKEGTDGFGFVLRKCIKVKPNTRYYVNFPHLIHFMQYKANGDLIKRNYPYVSTGYVTTSSETNYLNLFPVDGITPAWNEARRQEYKNCYISESEAMSSYEPHKSNILSTSEDVELRGIGDVQDELDLLTGEMTKQYGVAIMDGSDDENYIDNYNEISFVIYGEVNNQIFSNMKKNSYNILCDKYYVAKDADDGWRIHNDSTATGIYWFNNNLWIRIPLENLGGSHTKQAFKTWLQSNPITIQYELATPVVKTVDLTIVDQDGKTINKLNSFNGTTHVSTEVAENSAYPMVSLEVASELQAAMSKVAEDIELIKPVQNDIETTIDTQSNDIDSLLLATTELFEMFL